MASIINAEKNAPSRGNANKGPKSQGVDWSKRSKQSFPPDYGIAGPRYGTLDLNDLYKSNAAARKNNA